MRVGSLYAVLRLETRAFNAALATSQSKFSRFVAFMRGGALLAGTAIAGIGAGSVVAAATFDKHMNEALAIMDGVTADMRARMEETARSIAKNSTFSANQAADAFFYLAGAGYNAEQSIAALPVVTSFAQAGVMDLEQASEMLMNAMSSMGLKSDDAQTNMTNMTRVSDVMTAAQIRSTATLEQMMEALLNKAGPALRVVNKDVEEGAAVLSVFADQGIKGRSAGTALGIVLRELQTKAIKNADSWKELGVAAFDADGNMRHMADIVSDLEDALSGMSDEQKRATMTELGFTDRSMHFIQALLGKSDAIREYDTYLRQASGTTQDVADKQLDSFINQATIMWHKIVDVGISIGQYLLPGLKDMVTAIGNWVDENHDLIVSLATGVAGGIGAVIEGIGKLAGIIGTVLSPVFEVIGDVVGDFINLFKTIFGSDEGLSGVRQFTDQFAGAGEVIVPIVQGIGDRVTWLIEEVIPPLVDWFTQIAEVVMPKVGEALAFVGDEILPAIGDALTWFNENIMPAFYAAWDAIAGWINENMPLILDIVTMAMEGIGTAFTVAWNVAKWVVETVVPIIWGIIEPIATFLFPLIGGAASVLLEVIRFVFDLIGKIWQQVADSAVIVANAIGDAFEWLGDFFSGLWDGITGAFKGAINFIIDLINGFLGILNNIRVDIPRINIPGTDIGVGGGAIDPFDIGYIPRLARGTRSFAGGLAWIGEAGPELVNLPGGSSVIPSPFGPGGAGTMGTQVIQLVVDGKILAQTVRRQEYYGSGSSSRLPRS